MDCSQAESLYGLNDEVAAAGASSGGGGGDYSAPGRGNLLLINVLHIQFIS